MKLPLAQQILVPVFQPHPAVPEGELVLQIFLQPGSIAAVHQGGPGEVRHTGQGTILHWREGPVRQKDVQQTEARQKSTEQNGCDNLGYPGNFSVILLHKYISPSQNRKYRNGLYPASTRDAVQRISAPSTSRGCKTARVLSPSLSHSFPIRGVEPTIRITSVGRYVRSW